VSIDRPNAIDITRERIVFFDGVCNLCDSSVQFLLKKDRRSALKYASLQSGFAERVLQDFKVPEGYLDSIVFLDRGDLYYSSQAVLRICRYLPFPWKAAWSLRFIPGPIRDRVYRWIARNRYKWFGKKESCMIPSRDVSHLFLDSY
jgi:predicted DCC family thiol-disulfide oxidoreductase YuxK